MLGAGIRVRSVYSMSVRLQESSHHNSQRHHPCLPLLNLGSTCCWADLPAGNPVVDCGWFCGWCRCLPFLVSVCGIHPVISPSIHLILPRSTPYAGSPGSGTESCISINMHASTHMVRAEHRSYSADEQPRTNYLSWEDSVQLVTWQAQQ
ncbi:hypothetical protein BP00DRAFT_101294 [Aspergillus indologenus CBS 114.80]|uniref:Uncharacterized protein n=1 Tax=Aspergillus indologenus CBS 114.80 TaxID=1450541 RepID=A0A2V5HTK6_9EURO|nr:hypothetical protein BP00DRAFT_101294 [Aspergillus indologenus CBS 114.80]